MKYQRPMIIINEETSEGVYASSGTTNTPSCDSKYMNGVFKAPDYTGTSGNTVYHIHGCNGCPAFRNGNISGCALQLEHLWGSYDQDKGNRMPGWEREGKTPDTPAW